MIAKLNVDLNHFCEALVSMLSKFLEKNKQESPSLIQYSGDSLLIVGVLVFSRLGY